MAKNKSDKMVISLVLDESGSMSSVIGQTISGFNEYIATLKESKNADKIRFTLTQFNSDHVRVIYDGIRLAEVVDLDRDNYLPAGLTPLYDAIGATIRAVERSVKGKKRNVLIVIQTDGLENHSKEYDRQAIFDLIDAKKADGWSFAFLGADQDAFAASAAIGVGRGSTITYKSAETRRTFAVAAAASVNYADSGGEQTDSLFDRDSDKADKSGKARSRT
jgi:uncharacterized protein YegL